MTEVDYHKIYYYYWNEKPKLD